MSNSSLKNTLKNNPLKKMQVIKYPLLTTSAKFMPESLAGNILCSVIATAVLSVTLATPAYACQLPQSYYKNVSCTADARYFLAAKDSGLPVALLNTQGQKVADLMNYAQVDANKLSDGVMPVQASGKVGYIDTQGREVVPAIYDRLTDDAQTSGWARASNDNRIVVRKAGRWGVISTSNQIIVPFSSNYQNIQDYRNGVARVEQRSGPSWIATNGRAAANPDAPVAAPEKNATTTADSSVETVTTQTSTPVASVPRNEVWTLEQRDGKWGYINSQGVPMIQFTFDEAQPFSEGLAGVRVNNNWGFVDLSGDLVIPFRFSADGIVTDDDGETYQGKPPFVFTQGKAWIGNLNNGNKLCIDRQGTNVVCDEPVDAVRISSTRRLVSSGLIVASQVGNPIEGDTPAGVSEPNNITNNNVSDNNVSDNSNRSTTSQAPANMSIDGIEIAKSTTEILLTDGLSQEVVLNPLLDVEATMPTAVVPDNTEVIPVMTSAILQPPTISETPASINPSTRPTFGPDVVVSNNLLIATDVIETANVANVGYVDAVPSRHLNSQYEPVAQSISQSITQPLINNEPTRLVTTGTSPSYDAVTVQTAIDDNNSIQYEASTTNTARYDNSVAISTNANTPKNQTETNMNLALNIDPSVDTNQMSDLIAEPIINEQIINGAIINETMTNHDTAVAPGMLAPIMLAPIMHGSAQPVTPQTISSRYKLQNIQPQPVSIVSDFPEAVESVNTSMDIINATTSDVSIRYISNNESNQIETPNLVAPEIPASQMQINRIYGYSLE